MRTRMRVLAAGSVAVAATMAMGVPGAAARGRAAPPPAQDAVTASGVPGGPAFSLAVTSGPGGESPAGRYDVPRLFGSQITCLDVTGNIAVVGYRLLLPSPSGALVPEAEVRTLRLTDGPDTIESADLGRAPGDCSPLPPGTATTSGPADVTVVDASAPPASKDACRDGGFARWGFRSAGRCISWLVRSGTS